LVSVHLPPDVEIRIDTHRRLAASAVAIAVVGPELASPSPGVQPPPVVQLDVHVRVGSALHGRARSGPVLLPVEVPECRLIERARKPVAATEEAVPAVKGSRVRTAMQRAFGPLVEVPVHGRDHGANATLAIA